jgi:protein-S-isoprenylcysteine O-methyltransferase Ste14
MASKRKPERLEFILTQVLASVLTLVTLVPLFAFVDFTTQSSELAVMVIVFGAWLLVINMAFPFLQKRWDNQEPERVLGSLPRFGPQHRE